MDLNIRSGMVSARTTLPCVERMVSIAASASCAVTSEKWGSSPPTSSHRALNLLLRGDVQLSDKPSSALPSPLEREAVTAFQGDDMVEIEPDPSGEFFAQVIHTMVDEFSGKTSIYRIFSGTVPSDGSAFNSSANQPERMGSSFFLRGRERNATSGLLCGDIAAVAKLKITNTGDTLAANQTDIHFEKVQYPDPMMTYVVRPASKSASSKLKDSLDRILDEDPTLRVSTEDLTHNIVLHKYRQHIMRG